jgi:hypothetical protein
MKEKQIYILHDIGKSELTKEQAKQMLNDHNNGDKLPPNMIKIVGGMVDPDTATVN